MPNIFTRQYSLAQMFFNNNLQKVFPQLSELKLSETLSHQKIGNFAAKFIAKSFSGITNDNCITVSGSSSQGAAKGLKTRLKILDGFVNNLDSILAEIDNKSKLALNLSSLDLLSKISVEDSLVVFNEIMDNLNFNPEFAKSNKNIINSSGLLYSLQQAEWERRTNV